MLTKSSSWLKLAIFISLITLYSLFSKKSQKTLINPTPSPTSSPINPASPSPSIPPSPSPSPTPNPSPLPSPTPSPPPIPSPSPQPEYSQEEIHGFFEKYSNDYHIDIHVLRYIAICESGFNPKATNLYYAGLFQFNPSIWSYYRNMLNQDPDPGLRTNAKEAVKTAAYVLSINHAYIWPNCVPH